MISWKCFHPSFFQSRRHVGGGNSSSVQKLSGLLVWTQSWLHKAFSPRYVKLMWLTQTLNANTKKAYWTQCIPNIKVKAINKCEFHRELSFLYETARNWAQINILVYIVWIQYGFLLLKFHAYVSAVIHNCVCTHF